MKIQAVTIDTEKLNEMVVNSKTYYKYLIMSSETIKLLKQKCVSAALRTDKYNYQTFYGIPIAICNELKFGEVDFITDGCYSRL